MKTDLSHDVNALPVTDSLDIENYHAALVPHQSSNESYQNSGGVSRFGWVHILANSVSYNSRYAKDGLYLCTYSQSLWIKESAKCPKGKWFVLNLNQQNTP